MGFTSHGITEQCRIDSVEATADMNLLIACIIIGTEFTLAELSVFSNYGRPTDDDDIDSFDGDFDGSGENTEYQHAQFLSNNREYLPVDEEDNRKPNASYALSSEYDGPGPLYLPQTTTTIIPTTILIPAHEPPSIRVASTRVPPPAEPDEPLSIRVVSPAKPAEPPSVLLSVVSPMTRKFISVHPNAESITASNNPFNVLRGKK